jgi:hypothetical protein
VSFKKSPIFQIIRVKMSTVFFTKQTGIKAIKIDKRDLAIFIDDSGSRQKLRIEDAVKCLAKLDEANPEDKIVLVYLKQAKTKANLIDAALGREIDEERAKVHCNNPSEGYKIAQCSLNNTGEEIRVLALKSARNPLKASTEDEAFTIVDEIAKTKEGIALLKGLYAVERLGEKIGKELTPLEQEVLAYIAAY